MQYMLLEYTQTRVYYNPYRAKGYPYSYKYQCKRILSTCLIWDVVASLYESSPQLLSWWSVGCLRLSVVSQDEMNKFCNKTSSLLQAKSSLMPPTRHITVISETIFSANLLTDTKHLNQSPAWY